VRAAREGTFPLVPRHRLTGIPFGSAPSTRRGRGTDLAGSRPYEPRDPISTIDWHASARLSTARGEEQFVVRQRFAEEAPRVIVVVDRRPSMAPYPSGTPWLSKPDAVLSATRAIVRSALVARSAVGYVDHADGATRGGAPFWISPRSRGPLEPIEDRVAAAPYDAPVDSLARALEFLGRPSAWVTPGSFVFVLSDFLAPLEPAALVIANRRRWELVPVVIQDPIWEQSFPELPGVLLRVAEPGAPGSLDVRLMRREARALRAGNEARLSALLDAFAAARLDPVVLGVSEQRAVESSFVGWAEGRLALRGRR
jgi:uncharacterized protein (DUF58 family)